MQIDRKELIEEFLLRRYVRKAIRTVKEKKHTRTLEEKRLRDTIQVLVEQTTEELVEEKGKLKNLIHKMALSEAKKYASFGLNHLDDMLLNTNILKSLQTAFQGLTTSEDTRRSYRSHVLEAIENLFQIQSSLEGGEDSLEEPAQLEEQEAIEIAVDENPEGLMGATEEKETKDEKEAREKEEFGIGGLDKTGRNVALRMFRIIEKTLKTYWREMENEEDKTTFKKELITQMNLYFDKWEEELQSEITPPPTTPEYEKIKQAGGPEAVAAEPEPELGALGDLEL